jgi:F-type H+-transporting ATPase subunit epsilon
VPILCTITTPEKLVYEGEADLVVVPAADGEIGILPRHAPLMALLGTGELRLKKGGASESIFIQGGFLQVIHDKVNVLATDAEMTSRLDAAAAQADLEKLAAPGQGGRLSIDERNLHNQRLRAARIKARLARR